MTLHKYIIKEHIFYINIAQKNCEILILRREFYGIIIKQMFIDDF